MSFELRDGRSGKLLYNAPPDSRWYTSWTMTFRPDYALQVEGGGLHIFDASTSARTSLEMMT